jgi:protein TonB
MVVWARHHLLARAHRKLQVESSMPSWGRKSFVMAVIVLLHGAAVIGLMHIKRSVPDAAVHDVLIARLISTQQETATPAFVPVKTVVPTPTIEPPQLPIIDTVPTEPASRAINVPPPSAPIVGAPSDPGVPKVISTVEYVREPKPRYPQMSRKLREQGLVMLRVLIDEQGNACSIEIETSSGYARLDDAAREAVSRALFRPYVEDGRPRRAVVLIPIEFYLNRSA